MEDQIDTFMHAVGAKLKKKPEQMQGFIDKLKDNWYDTLDSLKEIDDDTWNNTLKFPSRLVKVILEELENEGQPDKAMEDDMEECIDTSTKHDKKEVRKVTTTKKKDILKPKAEESKEKSINVLPEEENGLLQGYLQSFYKEAGDDNTKIVTTLKTLTKIIDNLIKNPWEEKYRSLNTTKVAIQEKISCYQNICNFLSVCGFEDQGDSLTIKGYQGDVLNKAFNAIHNELKENQERFGVKVRSNFDAYQEGTFSTTGNKLSSGPAETSQYNPEYINKLIEQEKKLKQKLMERKVEDRDLVVFNTLAGTHDFKKVIQEYDEENKKEDEIYEEKLREASALKLLGDNAKSQKFGNKRLQEYQKLTKVKVYSTTIVRVKFPDGLVLQGRFGAREKISDVYDFVAENLLDQGRGFYLFKAPPKKILTEKSISLKKADLVPSGMVFFQWEDEELAESSKTISLDVARLQDKVKTF
ncbi:unnamed protein product [Moneuplotes crassus]|uniref:UBX domain-containing protein n=1 Tax=Euplotes crassus TaxID=5936 RepID=A0AAD1UCZ0_EUPCR|nr:unnamed protein product [Moneuplotes crassus]